MPAIGTSNAQPLEWRPLPSGESGFVNFGAIYHADHISAYAMLRVYSSREQQVAVLLGSDDQVRLWVNGVKIHEILTERAATPDEDAVPARLQRGWNTLLARVNNVTGPHALYLRLSQSPADLSRASAAAGQ